MMLPFDVSHYYQQGVQNININVVLSNSNFNDALAKGVQKLKTNTFTSEDLYYVGKLYMNSYRVKENKMTGIIYLQK